MAPKTLHVDPKDAVPIWKQIEHGVRRMVASRAMVAGSPIPSVRDLSRELRVNPATVAKAYQRLTDAGVLTVRRGEGTFVADEPPALPRAERLKTLREAAARYVAVAVTLGAADSETISEVEAAWVRTGRKLERGEPK